LEVSKLQKTSIHIRFTHLTNTRWPSMRSYPHAWITATVSWFDVFQGV